MIAALRPGRELIQFTGIRKKGIQQPDKPDETGRQGDPFVLASVCPGLVWHRVIGFEKWVGAVY